MPEPASQRVTRAYRRGYLNALRDAADDMGGVIASGDVAECAAPVPGEVGRESAVARRDSLFEEPESWLRAYAEQVERDGVPRKDTP